MIVDDDDRIRLNVINVHVLESDNRNPYRPEEKETYKSIKK